MANLVHCRERLSLQDALELEARLVERSEAGEVCVGVRHRGEQLLGERRKLDFVQAEGRDRHGLEERRDWTRHFGMLLSQAEIMGKPGKQVRTGGIVERHRHVAGADVARLFDQGLLGLRKRHWAVGAPYPNNDC